MAGVLQRITRPFSRKSKATDLFGLFRLDSRDRIDQDCDTDNLRASGSHAAGLNEVDIIAIHGLGGTPYGTWTHENGVLWLRDLAPRELPGVRVYTFGYDSSIAFSKGTGTLRDFSKNLLEAIKLERTTPELSRRRLVLVCHSMGGIVAKMAITIARNEPDSYLGIGKAVSGILFLGIPHQGSPSALYATILARTANALVIGSQISRLTGPIRTDLLQTLQRHESELLSVAEDFRIHTADIKIISFVEGRNMKGMTARIVDDHSAFVGAATERKVPMPGYDHRELCKHESLNSHGLRLLMGALKECISMDMSKNLHTLEPPYGAHPPFVNIPFQQNSAFVGQQNILESLKRSFHVGLGNREASLYGLGGIGKSQIALQYVYHVKESNPQTAIFWVFAGTKERFEHDYLEIAKGLKLPGCNSADTDILKLVKISLEKPESGNWIMVIDNADDLSTFRGSPEPGEADLGPGRTCYSNGLFNYIPRGPFGLVLYTTRNKVDALELTSEGWIIQVTEMDMKDLKTLLQNKLYDETPDEEQCADLINNLGRLPLAIVQAASYIRQNSWSVSRYLKYFRSKDADLSFQLLLHNFRDQTRDVSVENSIFKTWMITMQQLEAQHPVAAEALFMMAFYNRQKIPRYLLIQENSSSVPSTNPKCISNTPPNNRDLLSRDAAHFILDQAIGTLVAYSLLSVAYDTEPESYSIHRLVQMFTLHWLAKHRKTADMWAGKALRCLVREFPAKEYDDWNKSAELLPHVHNFVDLQPSIAPPPLFLENLLIACSRYLTMRAQYALATKYANLAIEMVEKKQGDLNITIMDARYCLARIYRNTAYFREAEDLLRVVIGNYSNVFGAADARTLSAAAVLSHVLRGQDKHTESEKVARESFQAFDDQDLVEGTELAESKNAVAGALATVLGDIGQYKESLQIQQGTVNRLLTHYTREHPRVVHVLHDMAVTLNMDGQYAASRELSREVFSLNQRFYRLDHPRTSNIEYNLGLVLEREMDNEAAEKHFRNVIDSRTKQSLGENDPETIDCIRSLAHCLEKQQRHRAAAEYYQQAMQRLLRNDGPVVESTHTLALKEDIARCLRALNESATETRKDESVTENPIPSLVASSSFGGGGGAGGDECWLGSGRRGRYPMPSDPSYGR